MSREDFTRSLSPTSPCKGCPYREINCHSECGAYLAFRERLDEWKRARAQKRFDCRITHEDRKRGAKK